MRGKRGQISSQFNWVFVVIVGSLLLAFFYGAIQKQRGFSDMKVATKILNDLDLITVGAKVSRGTIQTINLPKANIQIDCADCSCRYFIKGVSKNFRDKIIFAPSYLKGREGIAWSLDWNTPYRVTNFLYLTSPEVRYILVGDKGQTQAYNIMEEINESINPVINRQVYDVSTIDVQDLNNYKVKFVYFGVDPLKYHDHLTKLDDMDDRDVRAISVPASSSFGKIVFYQKQKDGNQWKWEKTGESYFLGKEAILAAIFSEDEEMYACNMEKAFKRMWVTSQVYAERTKKLKMYYGEGVELHAEQCYRQLVNAEKSLDELSVSSKTLSSIFSNTEDQSTISRISGEAGTLNTRSKELENANTNVQLYSCPEIF